VPDPGTVVPVVRDYLLPIAKAQWVHPAGRSADICFAVERVAGRRPIGRERLVRRRDTAREAALGTQPAR